ncbi:hypothetical protein Q7C36_022052 [Tachysurus vachellii]|uniref:SNTX thioredoxin-like domain-containing protein n=1 Tax=Tachysurus vachellii TaxID=175792 RepID=A0AA88IR43_TACVA|nr:hypothetical protein Q7C36_022052 [Tachysurus vachellii]
MDSKCMEIAALGRALYPGILYDCRSDSFIPGVTLWDKKALRDDIDVHQKPKTQMNSATSDSLSDKANLLDISASLKASFLSGLVEVGGSAKYLQDTKSSVRQSRVTMQYSQTTTFEQLTMKELGNITYPQGNKNEKRIKFIIASISDPSNPGSSIKLYQNGSLTDHKFQPVSKPPKPLVETSDGKVTLKLSKSPTGKTVHFRVEAVSDVGVSEASNSVPFTIIGKLTVTVDQWVLVNGLEFCTFKHRRPLDKVTAIFIKGDIFMNTIAIIKVDDVNLNVSVSSPGNI